MNLSYYIFWFISRSYLQLISDLDELKRVYEDDEEKAV